MAIFSTSLTWIMPAMPSSLPHRIAFLQIHCSLVESVSALLSSSSSSSIFGYSVSYVYASDYRLELFNTARKFRWNVSYSEYVPNAFDFDIDLLRKVPSAYYVAPGATGELIAIDLIQGT